MNFGHYKQVRHMGGFFYTSLYGDRRVQDVYVSGSLSTEYEC